MDAHGKLIRLLLVKLVWVCKSTFFRDFQCISSLSSLSRQTCPESWEVATDLESSTRQCYLQAGGLWCSVGCSSNIIYPLGKLLPESVLMISPAPSNFKHPTCCRHIGACRSFCMPYWLSIICFGHVTNPMSIIWRFPAVFHMPHLRSIFLPPVELSRPVSKRINAESITATWKLPVSFPDGDPLETARFPQGLHDLSSYSWHVVCQETISLQLFCSNQLPTALHLQISSQRSHLESQNSWIQSKRLARHWLSQPSHPLVSYSPQGFSSD